jgi:hypothetical protein
MTKIPISTHREKFKDQIFYMAQKIDISTGCGFEIRMKFHTMR